jgi:hypothetical protein
MLLGLPLLAPGSWNTDCTQHAGSAGIGSRTGYWAAPASLAALRSAGDQAAGPALAPPRTWPCHRAWRLPSPVV